MDFPRVTPLVRVIQVSPTLHVRGRRWTYNVGDAHYNWLSNAIDDGRAKGAKWIIVTAHKPCLSVGVNNCPAPTSTGCWPAKKVDLVLHGHEHVYMRTHQLRSGVTGCATIPVGTYNAACVADNDNNSPPARARCSRRGAPAGRRCATWTRGRRGRLLRGTFGAELNPTYGLLDLP